jgi:hypothetical protein
VKERNYYRPRQVLKRISSDLVQPSPLFLNHNKLMKEPLRWTQVDPATILLLGWLVLILLIQGVSSGSTMIGNGHLIIQVGLPKSGTTSLMQGFDELGVVGSHWWFPPHECNHSAVDPIRAVSVSTNYMPSRWDHVPELSGCFLGTMIQKAIADGHKPFHYILQHGAHRNQSIQGFFQLDVCSVTPSHSFCRFPQVYALDQITEAYPNAYYIMTKRKSLEEHIASMHAWGDMVNRWKTHGYLDIFPGQSSAKTLLENGMLAVAGMENITRNFFRSRFQLKYLEVCLEDVGADQQIAQFLNITTFPLYHVNSGWYNRDGRTPAPTMQHVRAPSLSLHQHMRSASPSVRAPETVLTTPVPSALPMNMPVKDERPVPTVNTPSAISQPGNNVLDQLGVPLSPPPTGGSPHSGPAMDTVRPLSQPTTNDHHPIPVVTVPPPIQSLKDSARPVSDATLPPLKQPTLGLASATMPPSSQSTKDNLRTGLQ